jgi:hypothetical protein
MKSRLDFVVNTSYVEPIDSVRTMNPNKTIYSVRRMNSMYSKVLMGLVGISSLINLIGCTPKKDYTEIERERANVIAKNFLLNEKVNELEKRVQLYESGELVNQEQTKRETQLKEKSNELERKVERFVRFEEPIDFISEINNKYLELKNKDGCSSFLYCEGSDVVFYYDYEKSDLKLKLKSLPKRNNDGSISSKGLMGYDDNDKEIDFNANIRRSRKDSKLFDLTVEFLEGSEVIEFYVYEGVKILDYLPSE